MAENLSPAETPEKPSLLRRRSRNPIKNMMQHLSVEDPQEEGSIPRRDSLIRRLSRRASRSRSSTRSDGSGSVTGSTAQDPALCKACASWATDIEAIFRESEDEILGQLAPGGPADTFEKKEHAVTILKDLEEDRWSTTCPLCKLLWAVHVPSQGDGEYCLSGFSSRDTNYLLDRTRLFDSDHPAKKQQRSHAPAYLGVVPRKTGDGALSWDVDANWFRETGMLYRALPEPELPRTPSGNEDKQTWKRPASDLPEVAEYGIWGREMEQEIDMNVAVDWLRYCKTHHHERCARRPVLQEMEGFHLIDCLRSPPQVVDASLKEDFVALSYVWGENTTEAWPRVFRDAVAVTQELGLRYLWVDKICLAGAPPHIRMRQISRMNEIYEGAAVTIIAAYGKDATYGLPGVGSTSRPEQPKYTFLNNNNNITLVSSLPDPRLSVMNSTWYTRGWTYQEGFVARRRLIFTEHQMYWECEGMVCPESLILPLDFYHSSKEQRMCDFMRPGLFNGVSFIDNSWQSWKRLPPQLGGEEPSTLSIFREVDQHIVDYTKRQITVDEDSLTAFLGITRRLEMLARGRMANLVGIPVWPSVEEAPARGPPRTRDLFALSTSFWHHKEGETVRRRRHLPSWTWAGWKGAVEMFSSIAVTDVENKVKGRKFFNHHYVTATQLTRNEPTSMKWTYSPEMVLLSPDGSVAWDFGNNGRSRGMPRLPPQRYALRISNPLVLDKVKARTHSGGWMFNHLSVDVRLSNGSTAPPSIRTYVERHAHGEQMTVLWFVEETTVMLLVVERTERGDTWERVGRMRMGFVEGAREVMQRCRDLGGLLDELPLRRLGEDIILE
ncbi:hypothetical protein HJFPF1_09383 [Paramyrothecium foliicola]|nr:hypothetical protein HJFPF1_09383 [Paramyrothecium foliicola]